MRVIITESHQTLKANYNKRNFAIEIFGTGNNQSIEIDEVDSIGHCMGHRKSYRSPSHIVLRIVIMRYLDDRKDMKNFYDQTAQPTKLT